MTTDYSNTVIPGQVWTVEELERFRASAYREGYDNALAEAHLDRTTIIEECAQVIEQWENDDKPRTYLDLITAIRALKDQQ